MCGHRRQQPSQFQLCFDEQDDADAYQKDSNAGVDHGDGGKCPQNAGLGLKFLHGRASCCRSMQLFIPSRHCLDPADFPGMAARRSSCCRPDWKATAGDSPIRHRRYTVIAYRQTIIRYAGSYPHGCRRQTDRRAHCRYRVCCPLEGC